MTKTVWVGTRKGLFSFQRESGGWKLASTALIGDPITMVLTEQNGTVHAAQNLGHFGVKIKRSQDGGETCCTCGSQVTPAGSYTESS